MNSRRLARAYFLVQAIAVTAWWLILAVNHNARALFITRDVPFHTLGAFVTGDLMIIALGSAIISFRGERWESSSLAWLVTGAVVYAALYTVTAAIAGLATIMGAILMVPAATASVVSSIAISRNESVSTSAES